jgi:uncharacterized repeat protein (TIGR01451 family)/fimbrial isopeptide formation D2 family protein
MKACSCGCAISLMRIYLNEFDAAIYLMQHQLRHGLLLACALLILLTSTNTLAAITFNSATSGGGGANMELIREAATTGPTGQYVGLSFSSDVPLTNVYARAIVNGVNFSLDVTELANHPLGDLSTTLKTSYWYLNFSNVTINNGTFQVEIYSGGPPGVGTLQGTSPIYTLDNANNDTANSTQSSVFSTTFNGGNPIVLGQTFDVVVCYNINSNNASSRLVISPAATLDFDPAGLQLLNVPNVQMFTTAGCSGTLGVPFANQLYYPTGGSAALNALRVTYTFRAMSTGSNPLSPIVTSRTGQNRYNSDFATPVVVPAASNTVTLAKSVNITENATGNINVIYTVTATNSGSTAVTLDSIIDTLPSTPANATYVTNTSQFTNATGSLVAIGNPVINGQVLTWVNPGGATAFTIPAGGSRSLTFTANIPATNGAYTNNVIAKIGTVTIDTTLGTGDNVPATAATRIGPPILTVTKTADTPTIVNTATGTTARYTIKVANTGTASVATKLTDAGLPTGFTYLSTVAVNTPTSASCPVAATRTTTINPTEGATAPSWGDFTIRGGCEVSVQFDVAVASTVALGTYSNSANTTTTTTPATITNFDGTPPATTVDNVVVGSAILAVTKTTSTPTIVNTPTGTTATYSLTVTNSGTANATGVKVTDALPAGFTYVSTSSVTLNGTAVAASGFAVTGTTTPQWDTAPTGGFTINAGQTLVITFVANVASTVIDGTYHNSSSATSTNAASIANFDGTPVATTVDNVTVTSAVLAVTKTTSTPTITNTATGTTATYTLTMTNSGTANATGVKVIDTLAAGFTYDSTSSVTLNGTAVLATNFQTITTGTQTATTPQWDAAPTGGFTINAGQTLVITFVANVANSVVNGTYNNSASATGVARSIANFNGAANTSDDVTVATASTPILAVTKATSTPTVTNTATGTAATYTLTVTNSGTASATGVKVIDTLTTGFTYGSTSSVTLNGAAVLPANFQTIITGTQTSSTPQWDTNPTGGFTINAGQTLVITFVADVASAVANGTYNNSASASSTNTASITNFNGATNTSDDVTVTNPVLGVSLSGFVYSDVNHNIQKDSAEAGTGLTLFAKLIPTAGGNALQAVPVNSTTGAYQFLAVAVGNYSIIIDNNNTLTDTTPTILAGWVGTEIPDFTRSNIAVSSTELQNLNFGLFNGSKLSGTVFADAGIVSGIANNGIKDGGELGIAGVTAKASTGATIYDTTITDGAGNYTLWIPAAATGTISITETNLSNYLSTGGVNTTGTYTRATDTTSFTIATIGTIYTNVNFGDVPVNTFSANGLQAGLPGNVLFYPHQFNAGSGGSVTFTSVSASGWPTVLYRDLNCNGVIDATDTVLSSSIVVAGEQICLINKVTIPTGTALGLQDSATVQAEFTYTNAIPALTSTLSVIDTTTVGTAGLVLTKAVDKVTAQAGETITYTLTYINNSNAPLSSIVINDATPEHTNFLFASCITPLPAAISACAIVSAPVAGGVGSVRWQLTGTLPPASTGQVRYSVNINN